MHTTHNNYIGCRQTDRQIVCVAQKAHFLLERQLLEDTTECRYSLWQSHRWNDGLCNQVFTGYNELRQHFARATLAVAGARMAYGIGAAVTGNTMRLQIEFRTTTIEAAILSFLLPRQAFQEQGRKNRLNEDPFLIAWAGESFLCVC